MTRLTLIILAVAVLSSLYGQVVIDHTDLFNIYTFHIPMVAFDLGAIYLIRSKPKQPITDILTVLLGLSIVNHGVGGYGWSSDLHGVTDAYDSIRPAIFVLELLVLLGGWYGRISSAISNARSLTVARSGTPGVLVVQSDKADNVCN